jgi:YD repeat-containing protein
MTANEGTAQTLLNTAGKTDAVLHVTTSRNGAVTQTHNSYSSLTDGTNNHAFLTAATQYVNTNIATTTQYNNNVQTAGVIGSQVLGGQNNSVQYGYNGSSYPVAVVKNASSVATMVPATITTSGTLDDFSSDYFNFTIVGTGNYATFSLSFQNSPVYGNHTTDAYTITGPSPQSGTLCYSLGGTACPTGPPSNTVTYVLPAGSYSFHGNGSTTDPTSLPNVSYTYTSQGYVASNVNEFFLENFEENTSAVTGTAHTGNRYLNGNFTPPFNPSVSRKYLIQYWTLVSGKWNFTQASYSYPMTITGPVDDVRIFPVDALMTSYTYAPLVGKTSEIDPTGNTVYYEYDGLGRPSRTRDLNGFITKKYCYNNYLGASSCPATSNINNTYNNSNTTWTATLTNVLTGTVYTYSIPNTLHPVNNLVIPVGNYNLSMSPGNGVTHVVGFDGYTMSGIGAAAFSLTNIPISNDVIFNITN